MARHPEWIIDPEKAAMWEAPNGSRRVSYLVDAETCGATDISAGLFYLHPGHETVADIHPDSEEIYYVVSGRGELTMDGEMYEVARGMVIYIPAGVTHQSFNTGDGDLCYFFAFGPPPKGLGVQKGFRKIRDAEAAG